MMAEHLDMVREKVFWYIEGFYEIGSAHSFWALVESVENTDTVSIEEPKVFHCVMHSLFK
jgi:hypothetical protein